jgi:hypothetical protein
VRAVEIRPSMFVLAAPSAFIVSLCNGLQDASIAISLQPVFGIFRRFHNFAASCQRLFEFCSLKTTFSDSPLSDDTAKDNPAALFDSLKYNLGCLCKHRQLVP